jgi:hypothetical protein
MIFGLRRGGNAYYAIGRFKQHVTELDLAWSITNTGDFAELGTDMVKNVLLNDASSRQLDTGHRCFHRWLRSGRGRSRNGSPPLGDSQVEEYLLSTPMTAALSSVHVWRLQQHGICKCLHKVRHEMVLPRRPR